MLVGSGFALTKVMRTWSRCVWVVAATAIAPMLSISAQGSTDVEGAPVAASPEGGHSEEGGEFKTRTPVVYAAHYRSLKVERRWYGWQTLIADGLSVVTVFGLVALPFATPIIHAAHGHEGKAWGSLGMRAGSVAAGGVVATVLENDCSPNRESDCRLWAALWGYLVGAVGLVTSVVVDAALIAYEDEPPPPTTVSFVPALDFNAQGFRAGLVGTF